LTAGSPNLGGPIATAGGLVFTAAAMDDHIRAFDIESGKELWKHALPAGGQATPMTYRVDGRQYVVIAAGGHGKLGTTPGDFVLAFARPWGTLGEEKVGADAPLLGRGPGRGPPGRSEPVRPRVPVRPSLDRGLRRRLLPRRPRRSRGRGRVRLRGGHRGPAAAWPPGRSH